MSVKKRVKLFAKSSNLTISAFEKEINSSNGYVNSISKSIGIDKIELILEKFPKLNIEWLLTGKGEMLKNSTDNISSNKNLIPLYSDVGTIGGREMTADMSGALWG